MAFPRVYTNLSLKFSSYVLGRNFPCIFAIGFNFHIFLIKCHKPRCIIKYEILYHIVVRLYETFFLNRRTIPRQTIFKSWFTVSKWNSIIEPDFKLLVPTPAATFLALKLQR